MLDHLCGQASLDLLQTLATASQKPYSSGKMVEIVIIGRDDRMAVSCPLVTVPAVLLSNQFARCRPKQLCCSSVYKQF